MRGTVLLRFVPLGLLVFLAMVPCLARAEAQTQSVRPRIAITMTVPDDAESTATRFDLAVRSTYVDAVIQAGGLPVLLPPVTDLSLIPQFVDLADGFIFVGGPDINPARFGQAPHETAKPIHPRREEFDFALMKGALETSKPILGVCLGMQMIHVAHGGSMIQDIPSLTSSTIDHRPGREGGRYAHEVDLVEGTRLREMMSTSSLTVNSIHHQACVVGPQSPLRVAARAPDGIVEAIEAPGERFLLGVQWHPEALADDPFHLRIFQSLVKAAQK
jgi:putative glutamine amidotransferase